MTGGTAPFTLLIDGETQDGDGLYIGQSGIADVSCALTHEESFIDDLGSRGYLNRPLVDSGHKTIAATVTDATGRSATATVDTYVILAAAFHRHLLRSGETYRIEGGLITIPEGLNI